MKSYCEKITPIFSKKAEQQRMDIKLTQTRTQHFRSVTTEFLYAYNWKYRSILNLKLWMSKFQNLQGPVQKFQDSPDLESKYSNFTTFQVFKDMREPCNC